MSSNSLAPQFVNYSGHYVVREGRGGGVSINVQNSLPCYNIPCCNMSTFECIGLVIRVNELMNILALCVYRPPATDLTIFLEEMDDLLKYLADNYPDIDKLILGGDFNVNLLDGAKHVDFVYGFVNVTFFFSKYI